MKLWLIFLPCIFYNIYPPLYQLHLFAVFVLVIKKNPENVFYPNPLHQCDPEEPFGETKVDAFLVM